MNPICVECGKEMFCCQNGTVVYHPYEHAKPNEVAQEKVGNVTIVNTDVLIEGRWQEGDIDFAVQGDTYECPYCHAKIVTGFGERMIDYQVKQEFLQKIVKKAIERGYAVKILRKE
jgi:hypothetical protein